MRPEDKERRREAILDAAERLLARSPSRVPSIAEVAEEAGLAKGTVYLYFTAKEEMLLALHERQVDHYFAELRAVLESEAAIVVDSFLAITHEHVSSSPIFLALAARCMGTLIHHIPAEPAIAFRHRVDERLQRAGIAMERRLPTLPAGEGARLFRRTYVLVLGLWQLSTVMPEDAGPLDNDARDTSSQSILEYRDELDRALRTLWRGTPGLPQ
jgi:AcrR family transcriptional regulator